ncbi:MAG: hypothetical protein WCS73_05465 [Lentisphaeria bacterium]
MNHPEITWSLMHPTPIDVDYMRQIVEKAKNYTVDSFEICGACADKLGGINGLMLLEPYPTAAKKCERELILKNQQDLAAIVKIATETGRPLYLWHREIMMPEGMLEDRPALLDKQGEFDLLGEDFAEFLRYKIDNAFKVVPDLGGIVLTLTEADYSVIHNSDPDRYPPDKVVEKIVRIFAEEHEKRQKRFILRSFGSIASDYEDILRGARAAAKDHSFDIETKITPYDFDPFLPTNPFLKKDENTQLNAECDGIGEFLGAGYLPAADLEDIERYTKESHKAGVSRYAIRLDRVGNSIFNCHEINIYAYQQRILHPDLTAEDIYSEYAANHWQGCEKEMIALNKCGIEAVKKTNFIAGNVMFHAFPIPADFKWISAGGIIGVFKNHVSLKQLRGIWGILSEHNSPGRDTIRDEKQEAIELAQEGLAEAKRLAPKLNPEEAEKLLRVWEILNIVAPAIASFVECLIGYFDDLQKEAEVPKNLLRAQNAAEKTILSMLHYAPKKTAAIKSCYDALTLGDDIDQVYLKPLLFLCQELTNQYSAEHTLRTQLLTSKTTDLVLPGSFGDQYRVFRYMHASHSLLKNNIPVRYVGNHVFPNGFIQLEMSCMPDDEIEIGVLHNSAKNIKITINGNIQIIPVPKDNIIRMDVPKQKRLTLRIEKSGIDYPGIIYVKTTR